MPSTYKSFEEIKELLAAYPSDYESVLQSGCYVISGGEAVSGQDLYDSFAQNVDNGIPDDITIVNFTAEGDPIYGYLYYDGSTFTYTEDCSRDKYAGDLSDYFQLEYNYLINYSEDGSSYTFLSDEQGIPYDPSEEIAPGGKPSCFPLFILNENNIES